MEWEEFNHVHWIKSLVWNSKKFTHYHNSKNIVTIIVKMKTLIQVCMKEILICEGICIFEQKKVNAENNWQAMKRIKEQTLFKLVEHQGVPVSVW